MPALAITDTNNLFGALEFSEKVAKAGLQPIIGIQLAIGFGDGSMLASRGGEDGAGRAPLVLLAKDERGYLNLMHLASRAFLDPTPGEAAHVGLHRLEGRTDGLIALTGGPGGPLDRCYGYGRPEVGAGAPDEAGDAVRRSGSTSSCSATASPRSARPRAG